MSLLPGLLYCTCIPKILRILRVTFPLLIVLASKKWNYWVVNTLPSFGDYGLLNSMRVEKFRSRQKATLEFEVFPFINPSLKPGISPFYLIYMEDFIELSSQLCLAWTLSIGDAYHHLVWWTRHFTTNSAGSYKNVSSLLFHSRSSPVSRNQDDNTTHIVRKACWIPNDDYIDSHVLLSFLNMPAESDKGEEGEKGEKEVSGC